MIVNRLVSRSVLRLLIAGACTMAASTSYAAAWDVQSPNGQIHLTVELAAPPGADYPQDKPRLYYRVEHGAPAARSVVIPDSPLGLMLQGQDFVDGLAFVSADGPRKIDERYTAIHGKRRECHNQANALTLHFKNATGDPLELEIRAYNDGAAFRYALPATTAEPRTLQSEATGFAPPAGAKLWMQPQDEIRPYSPAYETFYENGMAAGVKCPTTKGWSLPVLFCTPDDKHWGLLADAAVGLNDYGAHLTGAAPGGVYRFGLPDPAEGNGYGHPLPSIQTPWTSAWRAIILGDSPGAILESTLVEDLSPPTSLTDTSWIRPGRVAWSWWSEPMSPQDGGKQKRFVEFAAEMGWEYLLVDANWDIMDNGNIHDVLRRAKEKNVGILLWYNGGGPINNITEKPRDCLFQPRVRQYEFKLLKKWGVKGLKIDFMQSDKPEVMAYYQDILKDAAAAGFMISFHGCTIPKGWSRTYPNLMTMEAVRGAETYLFEKDFPDIAPVQNTILPFTRNAVGPMDYTPMGLTPKDYPHKTTYAHELALTVLFESGWLCFADDADVYRALPEAPRQFIKNVPVAWDDTRFVSGYPGRNVVLARRHGDSWYVAGVNGLNEPRQQTLDLGKFLPAGTFHLTLITDGPDAKSFGGETRDVTAADSVEAQLQPYGGFVAQLSPKR
jgi:alpha-glucosidase